MRQLRIFVSSPGDLAVERRLVEEVVNGLGAMPQISDRFALRALSWEAGVPPVLGDPAQTLVDRYLGAARDAEILVVLVGTKLGSPLVDGRTGRPYPSGTEYELDSAYEAYRSKGRPKLLVYRQEGAALDAATAVEKERLGAFWDRFEGGERRYEGINPKRFASVTVLLDSLSRDLSNVIYRIDQRDRRRKRIAALSGVILSAVLGWATRGWFQQRQAESTVNRIVDAALQSEAKGGDPEAIWETVPTALLALGPGAVRPIFDRLGDPALYEGKVHESRANQSPTRALVWALARQAAKGDRDSVCEKLFQILHSGKSPLRYPKSTHRIAMQEGIAKMSCPRSKDELCAYLAQVGPNDFVQPTGVLVDLRAAASPPLSQDEAERCFARRLQP